MDRGGIINNMHTLITWLSPKQWKELKIQTSWWFHFNIEPCLGGDIYYICLLGLEITVF